MNTLDNKAIENLNLLFKLKESDNLIAQNGKLLINEEYDQVNNKTDIEYAIYFTFHQTFMMNNYELICREDLINKLNQSIDNIYTNEKLIELMEDNDFNTIIEDIDGKVVQLMDGFFYKSPFYTMYRKYYSCLNIFKEIMNENNMYINRILGVLNKDFHKEYYIDEDDNDENDSGSGEDDNDDGNDADKED